MTKWPKKRELETGERGRKDGKRALFQSPDVEELGHQRPGHRTASGQVLRSGEAVGEDGDEAGEFGCDLDDLSAAADAGHGRWRFRRSCDR